MFYLDALTLTHICQGFCQILVFMVYLFEITGAALPPHFILKLREGSFRQSEGEHYVPEKLNPAYRFI